MTIPASGQISFSDFYGSSATGPVFGGGGGCTTCTNQIPTNFTYGASHQVTGSSATSEHQNFAIDPVTGVMLVVYKWAASTSYYLQPVTRSGSTFSRGASTTLGSSIKGEASITWIKSSGSLSKFLVATTYWNSAASELQGYLDIVTTDGATCSKVGSLQFSSTLPLVNAIDIQGDPHNEDKFLLGYTQKVVGTGRGSWDYFTGHIRVGSIAGTTISLGTDMALDDGTISDGNERGLCDIINTTVRHDPHTAGKFTVAYTAGWNYAESSAFGRFYQPYIRTGDISGTSIAWHNTDRSDDMVSLPTSSNTQIYGLEYLTGNRMAILHEHTKASLHIVTFDYTAGSSASGTINRQPAGNGVSTYATLFDSADGALWQPEYSTTDPVDYRKTRSQFWKTSTYGVINNPFTMSVCPLHTGDDIIVIGCRPELGWDWGEEYYLYIFKVDATTYLPALTHPPSPRRLDNTTIGAYGGIETGTAANGVPQLDVTILPAEGQTHDWIMLTREQTGYGNPSWTSPVPDSLGKMRLLTLNDNP